MWTFFIINKNNITYIILLNVPNRQCTYIYIVQIMSVFFRFLLLTDVTYAMLNFSLLKMFRFNFGHVTF